MGTMTKLFKIAMVTVATVGTLVACSKKNNDGGAGQVVTPFGACSTCAGWTQGSLVNAPAQGSGSFPVTFSFNLIGDQNMINQTAMSGLNPAKNYQGPVFMNGSMVVSANTFSGYCSIPAGTYQLNTLQVGQMSMGVFVIPQFEAIGPTRLILSMQQGVIVDPNLNGQIRINGQLLVLQGPGYGGATTNCNDGAGVWLN